jgi:cAMP-dependent protein kinase regulator
MIFQPKSSLGLLDQYLARHDYRSALEVLSEELRRRPESPSLLLRKAEILALAGERDQAIALYHELARTFVSEGFYARAAAINSKILRIDPARRELTHELAEEIDRRREQDLASRARLEQAATPPPPRRPTRRTQAQEAPAETSGERGASPSSEFFSAFPKDALESLLSSTSVRTFRSGQVVVQEGDAGNSLFLIGEGSVEVRTVDPQGHTIVLSHLGTGELFGEVSALTGRPRTASVVTREELERIFAAHPEVRGTLTELSERRAHATVDAMVARLRGRHG